MAPLTKEKTKATPDPNDKYVTTEQFETFGEGVMKALEGLSSKIASGVATPPTVEEKKVEKAAPNPHMQVPPEWEDKAREILGEALDHCELQLQGGTLFTVVIKDSHSNAPKDYLARYKADRRTREIGNEGIAGVEEWCKLVKTNLQKK